MIEKEIREGYAAHMLDLDNRDLIQLADLETLGKFKSDDDDNLAVQAAWKYAMLVSSERPEATIGEVKFFLGFVEGRCRVTAPQWWIDLLALQLGPESTTVRDTEPNIPSPSHRVLVGDRQIVLPAGANAKSVSDSILYSDETGNEIAVPNSLARNELLEVPYNLSGCFDDKFFYALIYDEMGEGPVIFCILREDGKIRWRKAIHHSEFRVPGMGQNRFYSIQIQAEQIVVFGMALNSRSAIYKIDPNSGIETFRFSSVFDSSRLR